MFFRLVSLFFCLLHASTISATTWLTPNEQQATAQELATLIASYSSGSSLPSLPPAIILTAIGTHPESIEREVNEARQALQHATVNKRKKSLTDAKAKLKVVREVLINKGVGRFVKAKLEDEYFGHDNKQKNSRYIEFECSFNKIQGSKYCSSASAEKADQRVTDRLKLIKMYDDQHMKSKHMDSHSQSMAIKEYTEGTGDGSYRDVNSVTRDSHARPTHGITEHMSKIWKHGFFKPVLTTSQVNKVVELDRALSNVEPWSGRLYRATTFVPLVTLGDEEYVIDLGETRSVSVNTAFIIITHYTRSNFSFS